MPDHTLIITTSPNPTPEMIARGEWVKSLCGGAIVRRDRGVQTLLKRYKADFCYVITRESEALHDHEERLFVHPGLFYLKVSDGMQHPLLRAIAPQGSTQVETLLDGTLGLAKDALHLASVLKIPIVGVEASPLLCALADYALRDLGQTRRRFAEPARNIFPVFADTLSFLITCPNDSFDVVYLDPMFRTPLRAQPGFPLLRRIAKPDPLSLPLLTHALRVAQKRVVIKVAGSAPAPIQAPPPPGFNRWVRGRAVDYYVMEKELCV